MNKVIHESSKTKKIVYEINKEHKRGVYYVNPECEMYKITQKINIKGFTRLPKGFSTDGYGFVTPAGTFLTSAIKDNFGENIKITISESSKTSFNNKTKLLVLNHLDYLTILEPLKVIRTERNIKSNQHVANILHQLFPKKCKSAEKVKSIYTYDDDKISKIVESDSDIIKKLSKNDINSILKLSTQLEEQKKIEFKYIDSHDKNRRKNEKVFLETIVKEYETRLLKNLSEADWQMFFRKYILLFNTYYVKSIEKLNIDLRGKYPDFLLANVYNYLDIFEIKKPITNILKHDDSRDNYYWDTEVSKAIIQTEKYIQMLIKKSQDVKDIIKEKHNIIVKVVRPRGFIIVGNSNQFQNIKMEDDFRLLSSSLKNIDIVLYDELLNNLKNMIKRLK